MAVHVADVQLAESASPQSSGGGDDGSDDYGGPRAKKARGAAAGKRGGRTGGRSAGAKAGPSQPKRLPRLTVDDDDEEDSAGAAGHGAGPAGTARSGPANADDDADIVMVESSEQADEDDDGDEEVGLVLGPACARAWDYSSATNLGGGGAEDCLARPCVWDEGGGDGAGTVPVAGDGGERAASCTMQCMWYAGPATQSWQCHATERNARFLHAEGAHAS